jgi:hypothetical protein
MNPPCRIGSRWKLAHAGPHPPPKRNPVKGTTTCPKSAPNYPLLSLRPPVQIFLDYFCRPRSEFRHPSGTQAPRVPEPGDKSPGYCHLSLRDAFRPGANRSWCQKVGQMSRVFQSRPLVGLRSKTSLNTHFVPGYDQPVSPGQKPFAHRSASQLS